MRSLLLGDTVRDWENIHLPSVKMSAGFIFSQEMSTSAINYSLNPIKKAFWALHFGITKLGKTKRTIVLSRTKFEGQDWRRGSKIFKNMRQQREKLFRQKEKHSMPIWKTEKTSCKFGHPPACQNYKSGTGCKFRIKCAFRHVEAEETPSKKSTKGGAKRSLALLTASTHLGCVTQDSSPRKSIQREKGQLGSKRAVKILQKHLAPN